MAVTFVGAWFYDSYANGNSSGGTIVWPSGTVAGASAIVLIAGYQPSNLSLTGATGWTCTRGRGHE